MALAVNKKGFSSLYIIMVLSALMLLILTVIESASGYALRSRAEAICRLSGESVLSEYQPGLWRRYGIFAVRASNERLSALANFYVGENLSVQGDNILRMKMMSCMADTQEYPALDTHRFAAQVHSAGAILTAEALLFDENSGRILPNVDKALKLSDMLRTDSEEALLQAEAPPEDEVPEEIGNTEEKVRMRSLLKRYRESGQPVYDEISWTKSIPSGAVAENLPTHCLDVPVRKMLLSGATLPGPSALLESAYILDKCSNGLNIAEGSSLDLEVEYILFGLPSDQENYEEIRSSLFWLRSALNLAHIYGNPQKKSEVTALAASALALIPLPAATFIVAGIWAAVEARSDVELLLSGKTVPFIKSAEDWSTDLDGALRAGPAADSLQRTSADIGSYGDYLRFFLLMADSRDRLVRLMDVMQLNVAGIEGGAFCFRDYAYGFNMEVRFEKQIRFPGYSGTGMRGATVVQKHVYQ